MHDVNSYEESLTELGVSFEQFKEKFVSQEYKDLIKNDFGRAAELNARSFPTLLLAKDGKLYVIAQGFSTAEKMINRIEELLK